MIVVVSRKAAEKRKGCLKRVKRVRHDTPVSGGHTRVQHSKSATGGTKLYVESHQVSGINATSNFH